MPDPEEEYKVYRDGCLYWEVRHSFHEEALFEMRPERWVGPALECSVNRKHNFILPNFLL